MTNNIIQEIDNLIKTNNVVLFMKGTADVPMCGFSATVVSILNKLEVPFKDVNILENTELREAIKEYSDWPTIPQLYIKGEFIGGCDIVKEMLKNGDLMNILKQR